MSCPTCDGTMALLCSHEDMRYASCDRCGTVVVSPVHPRPGFMPRVYVPKLVERVNQLRDMIENGQTPRESSVLAAMKRLGIDEATQLPAERSGHERS